jgi:hypothetical protein
VYFPELIYNIIKIPVNEFYEFYVQRHMADGGAGQSWAEQGADISVGPEGNRPSSPPEYRKQLF